MQVAKKVALVGFASSYKDAPYSDPDWEIWGLNEAWKYFPRWTRWFEMHKREVFAKEGDRDQAAHVAWLQAQDGQRPIYMLEAFSDIPGSVPFPIDALTAQFFPDQPQGYWTSTIAYMLALAIAEGFTEIGLYGIDLASETEYVGQRPAAEYLIGIARGMGLTVTIASGSALLKAPARYGYDQYAQHAKRPLTVAWLKNRHAELTAKHATALDTVHALDGAIAETVLHLQLAEALERGVQIAEVQ